MTKIENLTDAQWATIYEQRDIWLQRGLTTDPAPRAEVEVAISVIRSWLGRQPVPTLWFDGPATAIIFANLGANLRANLRANLDANLYANLRANLRANLDANLGANLRANLGANLRANLDANLRANLDANLRANLDARVSIPPCFYGSQELVWIAYYLVAHEHIRPMYLPEQLTQLRHWAVMAQAGWWFPYANLNIICEPPSAIHREDGRLHCDNGPAVTFRDGWQHWSVRGITVDEQIVMRPDSQTLDQIGKEQNAEVKRIRIERFGWERYLREANARIVDQRRNDVDMTHECLMRCDGMTVLVGACPSTGRVYAMEVDPNLETCEHAQAWLRNSSNGFCVGAS